MEVIEKQKKMKTKEDFQDRSKWAKIKHPGTKTLKAGIYHVCPICAGPYLVKEEKKEQPYGQENAKGNEIPVS